MMTDDGYISKNYGEDYFYISPSKEDRLIALLARNALIRRNRLLLFASIGAVIGKDVDGFLFLKYWRRLNFLKRNSQVIMRKPIAYFSGFCSCHRGLHWRT